MALVAAAPAQAQDAAGIPACVKKADGSVRIVKPGTKCKSSERSLQLAAQGPAGAPGAAGQPGETGAPGANGLPGAVGATGPIGLTGPAGPQGATGAGGRAGAQGATGLVGPAGAPGATGPAGPAGAPGTPGTSGSPGSPGMPGTIGPAGAVGPQGPAGPSGQTGPQGPIGLTGARGPAGPQGPAAASAPVPLRTLAGRWAMTVNGSAAFEIRSLSGCTQPRFAEPPLDCQVELIAAPDPPVMSWINLAIKGTEPTRAVEFLKFDVQSNVVGRIAVNDAFLHSVALTDLDAGAANEAARVTVRLGANAIQRSTPGGTISLPSRAPANNLVRSVFRLSVAGDPIPLSTKLKGIRFEAAIVSDVSGQRRYGGALTTDLSELTVSANDTKLRPWIADVVAGGKGRDLTIELLKGNLADVLMTWNLRDAVPLGDVEPFGVGAVDATAGTLSLDLQAARTSISVPVG